MSLYTTSTSTTDVTTETSSGTSTSTDFVDTTTLSHSTSIIGVIGGGSSEWLIPSLMLILAFLAFLIWRLKFRR
jgi:hypothetical protein